ncbi:MAG: hypothetical protein WC443_00905 [Desulfobaccales bacterium]
MPDNDKLQILREAGGNLCQDGVVIPIQLNAEGSSRVFGEGLDAIKSCLHLRAILQVQDAESAGSTAGNGYPRIGEARRAQSNYLKSIHLLLY